ncbi:restriction endonuclease [Anabaena sphaerica FACHB-251]|uniref:Restriction endonuclease n=1 Tax=Anabaena sphaerica FACHB-251 TaxID=2692883 RepID=A0A927A2V9_9NOST|nr:restriction endonuclease [Anabaena sphaerica]MBD2296164.1 restriction endonuclease [Anabaena sphaerica FACHB-251]
MTIIDIILICIFLYCLFVDYYHPSVFSEKESQLKHQTYSSYKRNYKQKKVKYRYRPIYEFDSMSGVEFEEFLAELLSEYGYLVTQTGYSQDYGADLILYKDNIKIVVQAKRSNKPVGVRAVQEVVGAINYYQANKAIVITNNDFSSNAHNLAKASQVELWDRRRLLDFIREINNPTKN